MMDQEKVNARFEMIAWGAIFTLLGTLSLIPGDQNSFFVLGIGMILMGLNLARVWRKMPINDFSIILGGMSILFGSLAVFRPALGWSLRFEITILPVIFIAAGLYLMMPGSKRAKNG